MAVLASGGPVGTPPVPAAPAAETVQASAPTIECRKRGAAKRSAARSSCAATRKALRARVRAATRKVRPRSRPARVPASRAPAWAKRPRKRAVPKRARQTNPLPSRTLARSASASAITSDEFNAATLDTSVWSFVNPLGDAMLAMDGSHARIGLAAGVRHDLWSNTDEVPRLMQAAPNTDFEVELKWDSAVTQGYHLQGVLVQQDADDMLRIETHHDGGGAHLFVARIAGGSASTVHFGDVAGGAPVYLRLKRQGSFWTVSTSANGTSWNVAATFTQPLTVTGIGPFAGNSGGEPPAFSSRIDYFRAIVAEPLDTTPPALSGISAEAGGVGATLRWQTNEPATSEVAYGTTTAYTGGTITRAARVSSHAVTLSGLACGTLYHYQLRSRDGQNNLGATGDRTFTTGPCPTSVASDEFNGSGLNTGIWTFVDPVGDIGATVSGGRAELSLPAGSRHDLWSAADEVPRLIQAAPNTNFEVEAKWDSAVTQGYHLQGILVQQDADDMLRIETHHDGGGARLFVARIASGVASVVHHSTIQGPTPAYFRLKRVGNTWTLRTSLDGDTWNVGATFTEGLTVRAIGPFAGNSGNNPPAFTSRIDYFRDVPPDVTPPVISAVSAQPTGAAAIVTWTTNEPAGSVVRYGPTTAYASGSVSRPEVGRQHSVTLHGLACATVYHYQARSRDLAGNEGAAPDATFTTPACPAHLKSDEFGAAALDTSTWSYVDPVGDTAFAQTGGHAQISLPAGARHDLWTGVDEVPRLLQAAPNTDFEVEAKYDSTVNAGYELQGIIVEQDADDLLRIETHHDGNEAFLFVASVTGGVANTVAVRSIPSSPSFWLRVARVGNQWTVRFSRDGDAYSLGASFTRAMSVSAVGPFGGNSGSNPPAFVSSVDHFREITDRVAPVISDLTVSPRSRSALVTWTTDEPATSRIAQGTTTAYGQLTGGTKLVTRHQVRVPALACGTSYHLQVRTADQLGNVQSSSDRPFTTTACSGSGGPEIDVWGGANQTFGAVGMPQRWVNVMGNVYDPDGVATLRATLNGASSQNLTVGPDGARLEYPGDFNLELNRDLLLPGANAVAITATDQAGNATTRIVTVDWRGHSSGAAAPANGPVLVVVAHGDDALLGAAGIIRRHKLAGRRVYVAAATNGDEPQTGSLSGYCGAAAGDPSTTAARGLQLSKETETAVGLLGLNRSTNLSQTELIFLGYPNFSLKQIADLGGAPWVGTGTRLGRTYGEDGDGSVATCNGDLRYLLGGQHSALTSTALAADFDSLLQLTNPSDIYTLVDFDGHTDHAEVARQTAASVRRLGLTTRIHGTVVHPHDSEDCMGFSAAAWPNPARVNDNPLTRFTPWLEFTAPPTPTCSLGTGFGWGPLGPPTESVEVPAEMQLTNPQQNLKWRTVNVWDSQCPPDDPAHVTCGYFNAFAKKNEFFWTQDFRSPRVWPATYAANWTSTPTISEKAQVVEGEWAYDAQRDGVRPLAPGFDRLLALGQFDWRSYEVSVPVTLHWFDSAKGTAGIGVILGWQGHTNYAGLQPRQGHPYGGICGFGRSSPEPALPRLELIRNEGDVEDTIMAAENPPRAITLGVQYTMRFRRTDLGNGSSRYSCKLWRSSTAEPGGWDLTTDLPDQLGTNSKFRGSALLMSHNTDVTFGDAQIVPLG